MKKLFLLFLVLSSLSGLAQDKPQPDTTIYSMVSVMPEYKGGRAEMNKFIAKNLKYPKTAQRDSISGKVYVNVVITPSGKVGRVWMARGLREDIDKEAIRVVKKMPSWIPGRRKDIPVNVRYTIPINFPFQ